MQAKLARIPYARKSRNENSKLRLTVREKIVIFLLPIPIIPTKLYASNVLRFTVISLNSMLPA